MLSIRIAHFFKSSCFVEGTTEKGLQNLYTWDHIHKTAFSL